MEETRAYGYWYDYSLGEYVYSLPPADDETARRFLPQSEAAQGLYACRREQGDDIFSAMGAVLMACLGVRNRGR